MTSKQPEKKPSKKLRALVQATGAKGLQESDVRLVRALLLFTSLSQKRMCLATLDRMERDGPVF